MASPGSPSGGKDLPLDPRKAIEELMVGKEFAAQVESRLREDTEIAALMDVVIGSISRALSSLYPYSDEYEISGGKRKTSLSGDKRGCYRKRIPPFPLRQQVTDTMDDGFIWRKYGQKIIQSSIHPRSYYRCLHKYDQGCQATRQVQKSPENPSRFLFTYHGHHTCKLLAPQHVIAYSSSLKEESLISFGSRAYNTPQDAPLLSSSVPTAEVLASPTPAGSSCSDTTMKSNLGTYEGSDVHGSRIMGSISDYEDVDIGGNEESVHGARNFVPVSDHGDVTPGLQSSLSSLDMNCLVDSFEYMDDMFNFDDGDFTYFKDGEGSPFF